MARAAAVSAGSDGARAGRRTASGEQARLPGGAGDRRAREAGGWLFAALTSERWCGGAASASASGGRQVGVGWASGDRPRGGTARRGVGGFGAVRRQKQRAGEAAGPCFRGICFGRERPPEALRIRPQKIRCECPPEALRIRPLAALRCSLAGAPLREPDCRPFAGAPVRLPAGGPPHSPAGSPPCSFAGVPVRPPPAPRRLPAAYQWHSMARSMKRTSIRPSGCSSTAARSNCTSPCHPSRAR